MRTHVVIIGGGPLGLWLLQVFSWSLTMMMHRFPGASDYECRMQDTGRRFGKQTPLRALLAENHRGLPYKRVWPTSGLRMARVWHSYRHLRPVPHAQKADPLTRLSARSDRSARGHSWPWFPISRAGRCGQMARLNGNQKLHQRTGPQAWVFADPAIFGRADAGRPAPADRYPQGLAPADVKNPDASR